MGGMGFIERFRVQCLRSILINTHMIEAAYREALDATSTPRRPAPTTPICRRTPTAAPLSETDAYPAMAERGYGWEKLLSEMFCQEYWAERGMKTFIARFHNVYGPHGTWDGGREKAPAAICRKVIEAKDKETGSIDIWGDGTQTRSFMYIDDCTQGIDRITHCDKLIATPINLGSSELIAINYAGDPGRRDRRSQAAADARPECPPWRGRTQQRQHDDQGHLGLGAVHSLPHRTGQDLRLDRRAVRGSQGGQADRARHHLSTPAMNRLCSLQLTDLIGEVPYRMAFAGGWIDQPFVSQLNPSPPGSMVVVGLEPTCWFMERAGMATGTRKVALQLWNGRLPERDPAELVRELYVAENRGKSEPSGSQDMIGLVYPGVNRLDYDYAHEGGIFPRHIESNNDPQVARWLE